MYEGLEGIVMGEVFRSCFFCKSGKDEEVVRRFEMAVPGG